MPTATRVNPLSYLTDQLEELKTMYPMIEKYARALPSARLMASE